MICKMKKNLKLTLKRFKFANPPPPYKRDPPTSKIFFELNTNAKYILSQNIYIYLKCPRLFQANFAYLSLSQNVSAYLKLAKIISAYIGLSQPISAYIGLSQPISAYLRVAQLISAYLSLFTSYLSLFQWSLFEFETQAEIFLASLRQADTF